MLCGCWVVVVMVYFDLKKFINRRESREVGEEKQKRERSALSMCAAIWSHGGRQGATCDPSNRSCEKTPKEATAQPRRYADTTTPQRTRYARRPDYNLPWTIWAWRPRPGGREVVVRELAPEAQRHHVLRSLAGLAHATPTRSGRASTREGKI
jgi:hypothetical protein